MQELACYCRHGYRPNETDEAWCKAQVRAAASPDIVAATGDVWVVRKIVVRARVEHGAVVFYHGIVLELADSGTGDIYRTGPAVLAPGARAFAAGDIRGVHQVCTWRQVYDLAVAWGIITAP